MPTILLIIMTPISVRITILTVIPLVRILLIILLILTIMYVLNKTMILKGHTMCLPDCPPVDRPACVDLPVCPPVYLPACLPVLSRSVSSSPLLFCSLLLSSPVLSCPVLPYPDVSGPVLSVRLSLCLPFFIRSRFSQSVRHHNTWTCILQASRSF